MTFSIKQLFGMRPMGKNMLYAYTTNDTKATIEGANYFGGAANHLRAGDVIIVSGDQDGTMFHTSYVVASNDGTTVVVTEHAAVTQNSIHEVELGLISTKAADAAILLRHVTTFAGVISKIYSVMNAALATGDATLTVKINGVAVTNGALTLTQAGSAAGDVDVATPTAANAFVAGDVITVTVGGASTATATANVSMKLTPT